MVVGSLNGKRKCGSTPVRDAMSAVSPCFIIGRLPPFRFYSPLEPPVAKITRNELYFSETASVGLRSGMIAMSDADIMLVAIKKISPYS